mmetsp:Transcript_8803/g.26127  ORF Transcript_8803/g.26127 Transcript_8803/m.26127 type:complete len:253 (+) Transcript_8803:1102-1860(+)
MPSESRSRTALPTKRRRSGGVTRWCRPRTVPSSSGPNPSRPRPAWRWSRASSGLCFWCCWRFASTRGLTGAGGGSLRRFGPRSSWCAWRATGPLRRSGIRPPRRIPICLEEEKGEEEEDCRMMAAKRMERERWEEEEEEQQHQQQHRRRRRRHPRRAISRRQGQRHRRRHRPRRAPTPLPSLATRAAPPPITDRWEWTERRLPSRPRRRRRRRPMHRRRPAISRKKKSSASESRPLPEGRNSAPVVVRREPL